MTLIVANRPHITTLINHKDKPKKSERTQQAIQRVGQAVSVAVGRFVAVGEAIAVENEELKEEMGMACFEARRADVGTPVAPPVDGRNTVFSDRTGMVKAARMLLSSVTKVLVLADRIVIKQIITSRNKVLVTLEQLERVSTFQEFVQIFSQFGNQMVEFAHLTGDRQNDLKEENKKARMAAARASARINKDAVFHRMRFALEQVIEIVTDAQPCGETKVLPLSIHTGIKDFKSSVEGLREGLYSLPHQALSGQLEAVLSLNAKESTEEMELSILKTCQSVHELRRELHKVAVGRAADLLKLHVEHLPLRALKASGGEGNVEAVTEYARTLGEQKEQLVETCRLLCHVSGTEPLEITCIHAEETFHVTGPQIISAAQTLALHPSSKIAKENLDVFCEAWESQLCDMGVLLREINDVFEGRRGVPASGRRGRRVGLPVVGEGSESRWCGERSCRLVGGIGCVGTGLLLGGEGGVGGVGVGRTSCWEERGVLEGWGWCGPPVGRRGGCWRGGGGAGLLLGGEGGVGGVGVGGVGGVGVGRASCWEERGVLERLGGTAPPGGLWGGVVPLVGVEGGCWRGGVGRSLQVGGEGGVIPIIRNLCGASRCSYLWATIRMTRNERDDIPLLKPLNREKHSANLKTVPLNTTTSLGEERINTVLKGPRQSFVCGKERMSRGAEYPGPALNVDRDGERKRERCDDDLHSLKGPGSPGGPTQEAGRPAPNQGRGEEADRGRKGGPGRRGRRPKKKGGGAGENPGREKERAGGGSQKARGGRARDLSPREISRGSRREG
ncbi:unnamed protein product, partial [Coregonus sp. 'balchen']